VLALVATPFVASLSQTRGKAAPKSEASAKKSPDVQQQGQHDDEKCEKGKSQQGQHEDGEKSCATTPAPAPAPAPPPVAAGIAEIHGTVFYDQDKNGLMGTYEPRLAGWTVTLSGPVSATTTSDVTGAYAFTALPVGTYTVCEVVQAGWTQTAPKSGAACPGGIGWLLDVPANMPGLWYTTIDFGNFR
jgi:hypothetical protein